MEQKACIYMHYNNTTDSYDDRMVVDAATNTVLTHYMAHFIPIPTC